MSDIEDFTTAALLAEVMRRVGCVDVRQCWYCRRNIHAHTCKYAESPRFYGWQVEPPVRYRDGADNLGWRTVASRTGDGATVDGSGFTRDVADRLCFAAIERTDRENPADFGRGSTLPGPGRDA